MKILNQSKNSVIAEQGQIADTVVSRMVGLLNRSSLPPQEALVITQTRSIHMFFMRFAIDVIFIDRNNTVVGLVANIKPFAMSPYFFRASSAIEAVPGTIQRSRTEIGDTILMQ